MAWAWGAALKDGGLDSGPAAGAGEPTIGAMPHPRLHAVRLAVLGTIAIGLAAVLLAQQLGPEPSIALPPAAERPVAPEFPANFTWFNTPHKLTLHGDLKGRVVVLDFWTYCCINCMHILPDLAFLEHKYAHEPVAIIGVHSNKFTDEGQAAQIRQAILRYHIRHPVIVDQHARLWTEYGVNAWPTFVVIDSAGRIAGSVSGEGNRAILDATIAQLLAEGKAQGTLAPNPKPLDIPAIHADPTRLYYPGKITADAAGAHLFIADSSHDRIVETDLQGKFERVFGSGVRGFKDGSAAEARFNNPQGLAVGGHFLYVADTDNHALRRVDLESGAVTTLAGDGRQGSDYTGGGKGRAQELCSPWGLALQGQTLYITMAGIHQLWMYDLASGVARRWVGSGREGLVDGPAESACLAQPSGAVVHGGWVYFVDSEASAVRRASLSDGHVETLIGHGLFHFGLRDGAWSGALLQHPLGIAMLGDNLVVADTYNHRLRLVDLKRHTIRTLYGGHRTELNEPGGLCVVHGQVYVADTNNQRVVCFDPMTGKAQVLPVVVSAGEAGETAAQHHPVE